ncbi:gfo/Idh/MocA family oxidoreductase [Neobacillus notoginsengisoli]|uniref:Gfo/Idh/MocA family oxidoreductase n=1 Tax=Neobacillus notoginsengisoli TaxID=1578198 RepID=A0A417YW58_9BACI|nr:Gfo/Idh/MocA family oxidoreductase [Neobacillus notoginsengisoli]RHW41640.1 gfo/Idh/MocA family oxidoreductase [Neobacillus notoginsengisoli]
MSTFDLDLNIHAVLPKRTDFKIGSIGAGAIVRNCHLVAYRNAGFKPFAITSLNGVGAALAAKEFDIPHVYSSWQELIADENIEILDIAVPPDQQLEIVKEAVKKKHIKGILCQKPMAMNLPEAIEIVRLCEEANVKLGVNSNMRYDQSMRALKTLLDHNYFGDIVLATIEMRAIPHWQDFLKKYDRLEILNMGIHHVDIFRYLFGDPERVTAITRSDPRTTFNHIDGISQYTFQYANELMATSLDDVWAWQGEGTEKDMYIKWRVEGLDGMAWGTIGWPASPAREPSTIKFTTRKHPNQWIEPTWDEVWFPDAFLGTMTQLLRAVEDNTEPEISGRDNLHTMAAIDACYLSIKEERTVLLSETLKEVYQHDLSRHI